MNELDRRTFLSLAPSIALAGSGKFDGLANRGSVRRTFRDIPSQFIHPNEAVIHTLGYSSPGDSGHATYVSDHLATPELAALAPRFCTISANGHCLRAAADALGLVPVTAGGAVGSSSFQISSLRNAQPAIAQALAYQVAIGANGLSFPDGNFSIWCPYRSAADDDIYVDKSGIPFLITKPTILQAGPNGTNFHRRKYDGSDPAIFQGTQYLSSNWGANGQGIYWRGGMFFLVGQPDPRPDYSQLASLTLKGSWNVNGGILQSQPPAGLSVTGTPPYYSLNSDGSGWDVTDKPIWAEQNFNTGDITFDGDITIGGFRGELLYQGGDTHGSIYQTGTLTMHDTDGDGFCPGPFFSNGTPDGFGTVQMQSLRITNAYQALEGATGWNSKIASIEIANCTKGGGLMSGIWGPQAQPSNRPPPVLTINKLKVARSISYTFYRGNHISTVNSTDTELWISQSDWGTSNVAIQTISIMADKKNVNGIIYFAELAQGSCATFGNSIGTVTLGQTADAQASGFWVINPVDWLGSLGQANVINRILGVAWAPPHSENPSSVVDMSPQININQLKYSYQL